MNAAATSDIVSQTDGRRFLVDHAPNGHFGIFDTAIGALVLRDADEALAKVVAGYLNSPGPLAGPEDEPLAEVVRTALRREWLPRAAGPLTDSAGPRYTIRR